MSQNNGISTVLLPHQQALLDTFFDARSSPCHVARWDVGLGSMWTMAFLIKRFLAANGISRILVLCPKALTHQAAYHFKSIDLPAVLVDRFCFRAMQGEALSGGAMWREGTVFILGIEFAKQTDIAASLCSVPWTLLTVPKAHQLRGKSENIVRELLTASPHLRMLLLTTPGAVDLPRFGIEEWTESTVRQRDVVDASGRRMFDIPQPIVRSVECPQNSSEMHIWQSVCEIVPLLGSIGGARGLLVSILQSSMNSSVSALEEVLRRLRSRLAHGNPLTVRSVDENDAETDADDLPPLPGVENLAALEAVNKCLTELDDFTEWDTKLQWLAKYFEDLTPDTGVPQSICILTQYRATLFYIQAALEEWGHSTIVLHGELSYEERHRAKQIFKQDGGILLATLAVTEGASLSSVQSLILYDPPRHRLAAEQILDRFQRIGRTEQLIIDVVNGGEITEVLAEILSAR
ncbi:MAG: Superfamily II DNA and RNA helicase [Verrucomicrobia bacterium]|nr:MAG: Superfamily II DNA and RNA helicase [Verrucomicrobiota bacterium]